MQISECLCFDFLFYLYPLHIRNGRLLSHLNIIILGGGGLKVCLYVVDICLLLQPVHVCNLFVLDGCLTESYTTSPLSTDK